VSAAVVALLADPSVERDLAAAFEEEGVPLLVELRDGDALVLGREAARRSPLGLGIGGAAEELVLVLAAWAARPYLSAPAAAARRFGHSAARITARRRV
jgi:hypothetical protein